MLELLDRDHWNAYHISSTVRGAVVALGTEQPMSPRPHIDLTLPGSHLKPVAWGDRRPGQPASSVRDLAAVAWRTGSALVTVAGRPKE